jgi:hypothetical protein
LAENIDELIHDAVQAFNSLIVTSDSMKLATEIDPEKH